MRETSSNANWWSKRYLCYGSSTLCSKFICRWLSYQAAGSNRLPACYQVACCILLLGVCTTRCLLCCKRQQLFLVSCPPIIGDYSSNSDALKAARSLLVCQYSLMSLCVYQSTVYILFPPPPMCLTVFCVFIDTFMFVFYTYVLKFGVS